MAKNESNERGMAQGLAISGSTTYDDLMKDVKQAVELEAPDESEDEEGGEPAAAEDRPAKSDEPPAAEEPAAEDVAEVPEDGSEGDDPEGGPQGRDDKGHFTRKSPVSDALLERAVRIGIPIGEARQFQTDALLSATVARLEGVQKAGVGEGDPAGGAKGSGEGDPADPVAAIDAIPDLSEEAVEPVIVKAFAALKKAARTNAQELVTLRGKGSQDFFATQLEGVKGLTKGDQSKETAIREEFDSLKAGYKASGKDVPDATVFAKAAQLVLGADVQAAARKDKVDAAARRAKQQISRASGQKATPKGGSEEEIVDKIDAKFFHR